MAVLKNDVWYTVVVEFGCVSYRILWAKFKFPRGKMRVVVVCGFTEGDVEERDRFWNYLYRVVHIEGNGYRLCVRRSEWMGWR